MSVTLAQSDGDQCSYTHTLHQLRDGIERMKSLLADMTHDWNLDQSPIHHIPEELLTTIFSLALDRTPHRLPMRLEDYGEYDTEHTMVAHNAPLLVISHTCRKWRDIALGFPALWTLVDGRNIERLRTFMSRSRSLPISLFISTQTQGFETILRDDIHRINDLHLSMHKEYDEDLTIALLPLKAVHLHSLKLTYQCPDRFGFRDNFPSGILYDSPECLTQALALEVVRAPVHSGFPVLTHLRLNCVLSPDVFPGFFTMLGNCPQLRHFSLFGFVHYIFREPYTRPSAPTTLHHLRSAHFVGCAWPAVEIILQDLHFLSNALVYVTKVPWWERWPHTPLPIVEGLTSSELVFSGSRVQLIVNRPARGILIQSRLPSDWHNLDSWSSQLSATLSRATITSLRIGLLPWICGGHHTANAIRDILRCFADLEELRLYLTPAGGDTNLHFIDAMAEALCENPVRCPRLALLEIEISDFCTPSDLTGTTPSTYLAQMTKMLAARARMGHKLGRVVVTCAFLWNPEYASRFESWREFVAELEVRWGDAWTPLWEFDVPDADDCLEGIDAYWDCQDLQPDCYKPRCQLSTTCPMRVTRYAPVLVDAPSKTAC